MNLNAHRHKNRGGGGDVAAPSYGVEQSILGAIANFFVQQPSAKSEEKCFGKKFVLVCIKQKNGSHSDKRDESPEIRHFDQLLCGESRAKQS